MCATLELAGNGVCYADRQQAPVFKTQKTWGHHGLPKQTGCGKNFGKEHPRCASSFPCKRACGCTCRGLGQDKTAAPEGGEEQARPPVTPGFLVPRFREYLLLEIGFICGCCSGLVSKRFYHPLRVLNVQTELTGNGFLLVFFFANAKFPRCSRGWCSSRALLRPAEESQTSRPGPSTRRSPRVTLLLRGSSRLALPCRVRRWAARSLPTPCAALVPVFQSCVGLVGKKDVLFLNHFIAVLWGKNLK